MDPWVKVQPGKPFPQDRRNRQVNTYTQSKITGAETPEQKPPSATEGKPNSTWQSAGDQCG